jgi:hypothetical protein
MSWLAGDVAATATTTDAPEAEEELTYGELLFPGRSKDKLAEFNRTAVAEASF